MRGALVIAGAALALLAGCGGGGESSGGDGPQAQFVSLGCASCHTLAAVDAKGRVGPNLDETRPSVAKATDRLTNGGDGMPSFKSRLSAAEIRALAEYVSTSAGG